MLETILASTDATSLALTDTLFVIAASIILGIIISFVYIKTNKKSSYNSNFATTLIMLPVIIAIIILLVGNNIASAFSLAGAFSIIRFRSAPGDPKDISYVFFTLGVGLACGMGYIGYGAIFTVILCALMFILNYTNFGEPKTKAMLLKITIPEDLNYDDAFNEILNKYTNSWNIERIKTRDFGALFELDYIVDIKPNTNQKSFIDELRCRNGNLNISLILSGFNEKTF